MKSLRDLGLQEKRYENFIVCCVDIASNRQRIAETLVEKEFRQVFTP
jgi:hypothetical protein